MPASSTAPTGVVLLNMGAQATLDQVEPFLLELFADRDLVQLPAQRWLGPLTAKRRTPSVRATSPPATARPATQPVLSPTSAATAVPQPATASALNPSL